MCQRRKDSSGSTACLAHTASHNCNQCKIRFQFNIIRIHGTVDACKNFLLMFFKFILMNENGHSINSWWHMFERNTFVFKYTKHLAAKSDFWVHHCFFNCNRSKSTLSCNTGNCILRLSAGSFYDQSTLFFRCVCITDVDRDSFFTNREDCIFV